MVSLATARRIGKLLAVPAEVSFSMGDASLSYLPDFRAQSASESNPLPRSFRVPSLADFVESLPVELLLCQVSALRVFLRSTSSLSPRPRTLFVSPRCPSRSLSQNTFSYFLRCVILRSLPSPTPASLPSSASSSASGPSTSFYLGDVQVESAPGVFLWVL